jgi:transcriptional regulator of acetoin/glycerol metabolism
LAADPWRVRPFYRDHLGQAEAIKTMHAGETKPAHSARQLGIARSSVYRMLAEGDTESQ